MDKKLLRQIKFIDQALEISRNYFLDNFAKMICGDEPYDYFIYRSSSNLTKFFHELEIPYSHDGSTRWRWVKSVLEQISIEENGTQKLLKIYYGLFDNKLNITNQKYSILDDLLNNEKDTDDNSKKAKKAFKKLIEVSCEESSIPNFNDNLLNEIKRNEVVNINDKYCENLLKVAKEKFDRHQRKDAINDLWDIFERFKTYFDSSNKKKSTKVLISKMSAFTNIDKEYLEKEFLYLTSLGNNYNIRHHEHNKIILDDNAYDFLFYKILNFLNLIIDVLRNTDKK
ncbi:hypothetical protein [Francisella adeliensis]|uniref:Uncharacterized protein n=1 Tax=Francisella adeliensis TaxID=2007306 RepID=A0A2Z4Y0L7_9GAMM|nr:hypothetical protein [Francisella adeliensis]AXA34155.1 hypothetical protein CDH04_06955 [Francisella adeliensis]MBK2085536.1 hypothetical protein [Francisella adeliensis]MBK2096342.1 hypothetical protein [Francisella adeliensis]QIW12399.1 hypothetical protein FZC43_06955 [Francisella adeliensis]QIW14273.1 hypothetical protein FZC44_06955 [Francisella adeliensis]